MSKRIGVFICHCGHNIASTVDVYGLAKKIGEHPNVVYAEDYVYMCSDPGQKKVEAAIKEKHLDGDKAAERLTPHTIAAPHIRPA